MIACDPFSGRQLVGLVILAEGGRREPGRDLAGLRAAHPVGHREERRVEDEGVLVPAPHAARIGAACAARRASSLEPQLRVADLEQVALVEPMRRPLTRSPFT